MLPVRNVRFPFTGSLLCLWATLSLHLVSLRAAFCIEIEAGGALFLDAGRGAPSARGPVSHNAV